MRVEVAAVLGDSDSRRIAMSEEKQVPGPYELACHALSGLGGQAATGRSVDDTATLAVQLADSTRGRLRKKP